MNNILEFLLDRRSMPRLQQPAPDPQQLQLIYRAAMCAPDHGQIRPWRFLQIEGEGLVQLGELYAQALLKKEPAASAEQIKRARSMPLRAPMLLVLIACPQSHPKVPPQEQVIAAGCAGHGVLLAAQALGLGAFWRSGDYCRDAHVVQSLGLGADEQIIGFIYLGTPAQENRAGSRPDPAPHVRNWP